MAGLYKFIIHQQHTIHSFQLSLQAGRLLELQRDIISQHFCPDLVCSALTVSYSGPEVEGWATATGSWTKQSSPSPGVSGIKWPVAEVNSSQ